MSRKQWPCLICEKLYAENEGAERCEAAHKLKGLPACDNHYDRIATHEIGTHAPRGDGSSGFKMKHKLCDECHAAWKKRHVAFEYIT